MNIAVIKHENGVEEVVKIEGDEEIQEEELSRATILQNLKQFTVQDRIEYPVLPVLVDPHNNVNSDGNLEIMQQREETNGSGFTYVIQSEYINENGETTVEYRLADTLADERHYIVEEYATNYEEDSQGNVFETVYIQQEGAELQTSMEVTRDEEQPQQNEDVYEDEGQMTIVEEDSEAEQSILVVESLPQSVGSTVTEEQQPQPPRPTPVSHHPHSRAVTIKQEVSSQLSEEPLHLTSTPSQIKQNTRNELQQASEAIQSLAEAIINGQEKPKGTQLEEEVREEEERKEEERMILAKMQDKKQQEKKKKELVGELYTCMECDREFKSEAGVKMHIAAAHGPNQERTAQMSEEEKGNLDDKEKKVDILNFQICPCCGEPSDSAHTIGDFKCVKCDKLFVLKISLQRHYSIEHPVGEAWSCYECNKKFLEKSQLVDHVRVHQIKPVRCEDCGRQFGRKFHLERHKMQTGCMGGSVDLYTCRACGREFTRKDNLAEHLRSHLGTAKPKRMYPCELCDRGFSSSTMLNIHIRTHTGERPYACDVCDKKFPSSGALKKHRRMHTGEKPYKCLQCDKTFAAKETLNRHFKTHTGIKPHTCQFCGKSFIQATQLRAHIFHHTGENAFKCPYCGRAFNRKLRLTTHIKFMHEGAKPLQCPHEGCDKTFFRREDLQRHSIVHSGKKPHKCDECGKHFSTKSTLRNHSFVHRKEQPVTCETCGGAFIRQDCLIRHIRAKHRDVLEDIVAGVEKKRIKKRLVEIAGQYNAKEVLNNNMVWNELTLTESIKELLTLLVDEACLKEIGHPETPVDKVLDAVIKRCGHEPASDQKFDYIERLRENTKMLFTVVIDDCSVKDLLSNQTVDEVILHVLRLAKKNNMEDSKEGILQSYTEEPNQEQSPPETPGLENDSEAEDDPDDRIQDNNQDKTACYHAINIKFPHSSLENSDGQNLEVQDDHTQEEGSVIEDNHDEVYNEEIDGEEHELSIENEEMCNEEAEDNTFYEEPEEMVEERIDLSSENDQDVENEDLNEEQEEMMQERTYDINEGVFTTTVYLNEPSDEFYEDETTQENIIIEMTDD